MASFSIPLSGLSADSTALNTIANDLSNMNTTAFKAQTTNFSDLFYQQVGSTGSGNQIQVGDGAKVASNITDYTQGTYNTSGTTSSDVALDGNGFFVLNNGGTNVLTRDGAFTQDSSGNLVSADGFEVMGYPAVNGVVNTSAALTPIATPVNGDTMQPQATTSFGMTATLDSEATVGTTVTGEVPVYDSLGKSYEATVTYTKSGTDTWGYNITMPDTLKSTSATAGGSTTITYNFGVSGGNVAGVDAGTNLTITGSTGAGTATITAPAITVNETITQYANDLTTQLGLAGLGASVTVTPNAATGVLTISGAGVSTSGSLIQDPVASANTTGTLTFNANGDLVSPAADINGITFAGLSDGASGMSMTWNVLGTSNTPTISQADATSATSSPTQNGYASGSYQGFSVGSDGTVSATFSNGQTQTVGQLALADVTNLQGLSLQGDGNYAITTASGAATYGVSGTNGLGTIQDKSLEESNVNISAEFSQLIIAQRAFEANAKSVTTFDTVAQDTINMVH
jgi:flagellar hook protein FlgE